VEDQEEMEVDLDLGETLKPTGDELTGNHLLNARYSDSASAGRKKRVCTDNECVVII